MNENTTLEAAAETVEALEQVTAKYNEHRKTPLTLVQALKKLVAGHPLVSPLTAVMTLGAPLAAPA